MRRKVSTMEVRQKLGEILNCVALRHDQYIIERNGKAMAAVIPVEQLEQIEAAARLHILDVLKRCSSTVPTELADALADEAKHRSRKTRPTSRP